MFINKKSLNLRRTPFKHKVNNVVPVHKEETELVVEVTDIKAKTNQTGKSKKNNTSEGQKE